MLTLDDLEREHAFSERTCGCCETLASSMSVALENARLFDETQRLLKETEQRAAELAMINASSRAWPPSSTSRRSSTWSATSCAKFSASGDIGIRGGTSRRTSSAILYVFEHGVRDRARADAADREGAAAEVMYRRAPLVVTQRGGGSRASASALSPGTDRSMSSVFVPMSQRRPGARLDRARELRARERVRRRRGAPAVDRRRQHGRGARERAPVRRDAAAAEGDRAAQRRAGGDQQRAAGRGGRARLQVHRHRGGREAARSLQGARPVHLVVGGRQRAHTSRLQPLPG